MKIIAHKIVHFISWNREIYFIRSFYLSKVQKIKQAVVYKI